MIKFFKQLLGGPKVNYAELVSNGALIIDVRTPGEFKMGHIHNARNYPLDTIRGKVAELKKLNKPVITVCRSGARSGIARNILKTAGIEVYNGGAWTSLQSKIQ